MAATQHLTSSPLMRTIGAPGPGKAGLMRHDRVDFVLWFCTLSVIGSTSAADILPYRVVLFAGDLGPDRYASVGSGVDASANQALSRWPSLGPNGNGSRFQFSDSMTIVGTYCVPAAGSLGRIGECRAAIWQLGLPSSRIALALPPTAVASVARACNAQGLVAGAIIVDNAEGRTDIRAAAWQLPPMGSASTASVTVIADDPAWSDCNESGTNTWFTAVSPSEHLTGEALAVLSVGSLGGGSICASGTCVIPPQEPISAAIRLRSAGTAVGWCGSLQDTQSSEFAECFANERHAPLVSISDCVILGAQRPLVGATAACVQEQEWDGVAWKQVERDEVALHCPCDSAPVSVCVHQDTAAGLSYRVSAVRIGSWLTGSPSIGRAPMGGGCMGVNIREIGAECSTGLCSRMHAFVQMDPLKPVEASGLVDLHSVISQGQTCQPMHSAVAALTANTGGFQAHCVAVGMTSDGVWSDEELVGASGAIWLGRWSNSASEWCYLDANEVALQAPGWRIQSLHDATLGGVLLGIAQQSDSRRLCYLTSSADFDGDLRVDGGDVGVVLTSWGTNGAGSGEMPPVDLTGDQIVDGEDFGVLLTAWTGSDPDSRVRVVLDCQESQWQAAIIRLPFVEQAAYALGFDGLDGLADSLRPVARTARESVCACVSTLAELLAEDQHE